MYPYGNAAGDDSLTYFDRGTRINMPFKGMRFFDKRHRRIYVSEKQM